MSIGGTDGRDVGVFVNGNQYSSARVVGGTANFWIASLSPIQDAEIFFRYLDGAQEQSETHTGAEWEALLNPG